MRIGVLDRVLAEGGQEWPSDAPPDATVGGVLASGASSPRRLKVGALRDTVLEAEIVTGDGRLVRSGARTVKNVTGYDLHRLVVGSLGTLGVIVQVALKVRPRQRRRLTLRFEGDLGGAVESLDAAPGAGGVLATPGAIEVRLEGWEPEVDEQAEAVERSLGTPLECVEDGPFPSTAPWESSPVVVEAAVPPSRLELVTVGDAWGALLGVGLAWVGLDATNGSLTELRERVRSVGGIAPVIRGPGGLGDERVAAPGVQRRLKHAFDPNGVLAPGRSWGGS
jgi:glycolate oxidase FAD binding subunit